LNPLLSLLHHQKAKYPFINQKDLDVVKANQLMTTGSLWNGAISKPSGLPSGSSKLDTRPEYLQVQDQYPPYHNLFHLLHQIR
jgi:hypothetical protein